MNSIKKNLISSNLLNQNSQVNVLKKNSEFGRKFIRSVILSEKLLEGLVEERTFNLNDQNESLEIEFILKQKAIIFFYLNQKKNENTFI